MSLSTVSFFNSTISAFKKGKKNRAYQINQYPIYPNFNSHTDYKDAPHI